MISLARRVCDQLGRAAPKPIVLLAPALTCFAPQLAAAQEDDTLMRVLLLQDYNTRIVLFGATVLGICLGVVGVFMLLRRRSLMGDVVSHASLPGIAIAYLVAEAFSPGSGKNLFGLILGALSSGLAGMLAVIALHRFTRLKEDTALAVVLSVFFGAGVVLLSIIQSLPSGNAAGLHHFIYGKAASMVASDAQVIAVSSVAALLVIALLFKELRLLCFDESFARTQGWPATLLDLLLMTIVVAMSVIGLQSVGLLLVVAMLIIPATAGRFWSDELVGVVLAAGIVGGLSAYSGVIISALTPNASTGAVIVLSGAVLFIVSLLIGTQRGLIQRMVLFRRLQRRVANLHLLRAVFEVVETRDNGVDLQAPFTTAELAPLRSWTVKELNQVVRRAVRSGLCEPSGGNQYRLTGVGADRSIQAVRNHRLWEMYLIQFADIAPSHVDRDADDIEHVLGAEVVAELERVLEHEGQGAIPESPHEILGPAGES